MWDPSGITDIGYLHFIEGLKQASLCIVEWLLGLFGYSLYFQCGSGILSLQWGARGSAVG
jgi:hypothetical protein